MRMTVSKDFHISPIAVLELPIEKVLYHLCYIIDEHNLTKYLTNKKKQGV